MQRLASKLIDGIASDDEQLAFAKLLKANPEMHEAYVQLVQTEAALDEIHSRDLLSVQLGADDIDEINAGDAIAGLGVMREGHETTDAETSRPRVRSPFQRSPYARPKWSWATAAAVTFALFGYYFWPTAYVTIVATENVEWSDGSHHEIGERLGNDWVDIGPGVVQLAFDSTAAMTVEGPARFRATADNECELEFGSAIAYVPPAAIGFAVETPSMEVIDRGTSFRIEVGDNDATALQVLEGIVDAKSKAEGTYHRLVAGEVATVRDRTTGELIRASEEDLFPTTSRRIAFRAKHVPSLGHGGFKGNNRCYVFLERHAFELPHSLAVNVIDTGAHGRFDETAGDLQAGELVDCYLVHSAPHGKRHVVEGTITFNEDVLGVLVTSDRLNATNALFGSPWLLRCQHPERGLESAPNRNSDRIEISSDRRTLRLSVRTESIDQFRVLVRSSAQDELP